MPEPAEKSPAVDAMITQVTGIRRKQAVRRRQCPLCGGVAFEFKDERSRREHKISGMCQKCQDELFV